MYGVVKMLKYLRSSLLRNALLCAFLSLMFTGSALAAQVVDINTADATTMSENLNGIGASKAMAIIKYREANGAFATVDDLANVKGIGLKLIDRNRDFLSVGSKVSPAKVIEMPKQKANPQPAAQAN